DYFVAPAGPRGFITCKPSTEPQQQFHLNFDSKSTAIFYEVTAIFSSTNEPAVVFARRTGGLSVVTLTNGDSPRKQLRISLPGLDILDVCAMDSNAAVAAVSKDGTIVLIADACTPTPPKFVRFSQMRGTPYRVFSALGSILVLTSEALYVISDL